MSLGARVAMPTKKAGRPAEPEPMKSLVSLKGTPTFEAWLDELVEHSHQGTRSLLLRNALRVFAEREGFGKPQPKR
jgi:wyosine [tRNA(Phe)-imidazoG37] synthetase (radical SAM superfamily)